MTISEWIGYRTLVGAWTYLVFQDWTNDASGVTATSIINEAEYSFRPTDEEILIAYEEARTKYQNNFS